MKQTINILRSSPSREPGCMSETDRAIGATVEKVRYVVDLVEIGEGLGFKPVRSKRGGVGCMAVIEKIGFR